MESRQAGQTVRCACGAQVDVPTLRQLAQQATSEEPTAVRPQSWGARQRVALLAGLLSAAGVALIGWSLVTRPGAPHPTPLQATQFWQHVLEGKPDVTLEPWAGYDRDHDRFDTWLRTGIALTSLGLTAAIGVLLLGRRAPPG